MSVLHSLEKASEIPAHEALHWFQKSVFLNTPPYFLTHWKTNKKFFQSNKALIAYEETQRHLIVAGQPLMTKDSDEADLCRAFKNFALRKKKSICGYYVGRKWNWNSFYKVPIGTSSRIPLNKFRMESPEAHQARRAFRKGMERGYEIVPIPENRRKNNPQIKSLFNKWKSSKSILRLKFLLSSPETGHSVKHYEKWFMVKKEEQSLAFCNLLPYLTKGQYGFYVDHLFYDPTRESHALSYLISFLIESLKKDGVVELNLGLNPFARMDKNHPMEYFFSLLYNSPFLYRPRGLHFFKKKFAGTEEREYCFFQDYKNQWLGLADMAKVTLGFSKPSIAQLVKDH